MCIAFRIRPGVNKTFWSPVTPPETPFYRLPTATTVTLALLETGARMVLATHLYPQPVTTATNAQRTNVPVRTGPAFTSQTAPLAAAEPTQTAMTAWNALLTLAKPQPVPAPTPGVHAHK